jgi:hypothetical protein
MLEKPCLPFVVNGRPTQVADTNNYLAEQPFPFSLSWVRRAFAEVRWGSYERLRVLCTYGLSIARASIR